ncbi:MAG: hypothetical protein AAF938_26330 [Myxococcota bacterium]
MPEPTRLLGAALLGSFAVDPSLFAGFSCVNWTPLNTMELISAIEEVPGRVLATLAALLILGPPPGGGPSLRRAAARVCAASLLHVVVEGRVHVELTPSDFGAALMVHAAGVLGVAGCVCIALIDFVRAVLIGSAGVRQRSEAPACALRFSVAAFGTLFLTLVAMFYDSSRTHCWLHQGASLPQVDVELVTLGLEGEPAASTHSDIYLWTSAGLFIADAGQWRVLPRTAMMPSPGSSNSATVLAAGGLTTGHLPELFREVGHYNQVYFAAPVYEVPQELDRAYPAAALLQRALHGHVVLFDSRGRALLHPYERQCSPAALPAESMPIGEWLATKPCCVERGSPYAPSGRRVSYGEPTLGDHTPLTLGGLAAFLLLLVEALRRGGLRVVSAESLTWLSERDFDVEVDRRDPYRGGLVRTVDRRRLLRAGTQVVIGAVRIALPFVWTALVAILLASLLLRTIPQFLR